MEIDIQWYPCKPDAPALSVPSVISSLDWWVQERDLGVFAGYKVGEVPGAPRTYNAAKVNPAATGLHRCGTEEQWRDGASFDPAGNFPRRADGLPKCCGGQPAGMLIGGRAFVTPPPTGVMIGGDGEAGGVYIGFAVFEGVEGQVGQPFSRLPFFSQAEWRTYSPDRPIVVRSPVPITPHGAFDFTVTIDADSVYTGSTPDFLSSFFIGLTHVSGPDAGLTGMVVVLLP